MVYQYTIEIGRWQRKGNEIRIYSATYKNVIEGKIFSSKYNHKMISCYGALPTDKKGYDRFDILDKASRTHYFKIKFEPETFNVIEARVKIIKKLNGWWECEDEEERSKFEESITLKESDFTLTFIGKGYDNCESCKTKMSYGDYGDRPLCKSCRDENGYCGCGEYKEECRCEEEELA